MSSGASRSRRFHDAITHGWSGDTEDLARLFNLVLSQRGDSSSARDWLTKTREAKQRFSGDGEPIELPSPHIALAEREGYGTGGSELEAVLAVAKAGEVTSISLSYPAGIVSFPDRIEVSLDNDKYGRKVLEVQSPDAAWATLMHEELLSELRKRRPPWAWLMGPWAWGGLFWLTMQALFQPLVWAARYGPAGGRAAMLVAIGSLSILYWCGVGWFFRRRLPRVELAIRGEVSPGHRLYGRLGRLGTIYAVLLSLAVAVALVMP